LLKEKYEVVRIKPVDMFPHTQHVENVVLLKFVGSKPEDNLENN
jgi:23S rRNA (uracil1939-C5)-methyltransferase